MGFFTAILFSFLIVFPSFASICFEEVDRRLQERFGEVFEKVEAAGWLKKEPYEKEEIYALIAKVEKHFFKELSAFYQKQCLLLDLPPELDTIFHSVCTYPDSLEKMSLLFSIYRTYQLNERWNSFKKSPFLAEELKMLTQRIQDLQTMRSLESYEQAGRYEYVRFIGKMVFKRQIDRAPDVACFELACMLGISEAFQPSIYGFFDGQKGLMQPYCPKVIPSHNNFWFTLYRWVEYPSYLRCALGVLLFALEDMHPGNISYIPKKNGYFQICFWDSVGSFIYTTFHGLNKEGYTMLFPPYAWIGFDYPQYRYVFLEKEKTQLKEWAFEWTRIEHEIKSYLDSGLCELFLQKQEKTHFFYRLHLLIEMMEQGVGSVQKMHEKFCPEFPIIQNKLFEFYPQHLTMHTLFKMIWRPTYMFEKIPTPKRLELRHWIKDFLLQQSQRNGEEGQSP